MKKLICLFSLLFAAGQLAAHLHPTNGCWDLTAEYLYFRPSVDDTYFVISSVGSDGEPNGTRENNDFSFRSGFRVGGAYGFCGCNQEAQIYYTRLNAKTTKTVSGNAMGATKGSALLITTDGLDPFSGFAQSSLNCFYQRVDGLFAGQVFCCCGSNLYLFGGVEYASVRLNENINYVIDLTPPDTVLQKERTWGIGPQLGIDYDYYLCSFSACRCPGALSLVTRASTSLLVSKSRESLTTVGSAVFRANDHHSWRIVPAFHARVGINYTCSFNCWAAALEIGYEIDSYLRGLTRIFFTDSSALSYSASNYFNFDVQGLYVSATVGF